MDDETGTGAESGSSTGRSGRSTALAAVAAAAVVAVVLAATLVSHHRARSALTPPTASGASSLVSPTLLASSSTTSSTPLLVPTPSFVTAASPLATLPPIASPAGPPPEPPADGIYFCYGSLTGSALCADRTGAVVRNLPVSIGPDDVSIDTADGYVYYRQFLTDSHGNVEQIGRLPIAGGTAQVLVHGPSSVNDTEVSFGSPVVSPDGNFLAYGQMTLTMTVPSPGSAAGPNPPGRLVQVVVRNLRDLSATPMIVPATLVGSDIAAGPLLGWSANSRTLYLAGPDQLIESLKIGPDGTATAVSTVFDLKTLPPGCNPARTVMAPSGDFFVVTSCASAIQVFDVHSGVARPYSALLHTDGWQVSGVELDDTGRLIAVSFSAPPQSPQCVGVDGATRIIDGIPTDVSLSTSPGCYNPGGPMMPAGSAASSGSEVSSGPQ